MSDAILLKQGTLDEVEWREMRMHTEKGYRIVAKIPGMAEAAEIVFSHEVKWTPLSRQFQREFKFFF